MSEKKRKMYLYDENAPVTKYAITKAIKSIEEEKIDDLHKINCSSIPIEPELPAIRQLVETIKIDDNNPIVGDTQNAKSSDVYDYKLFDSDNIATDILYEDIYSSDEELSSLLKETMKSANTVRD
ncbi:uncharacterized protein LOC116417856 [Nasonia vitripennis]|uniref:Uncharacterized protein n=1 Tax=Nasonia vitripennis TaxID=7425 RepID=A0A7M7TB91_NASVI|nr:uncharacterized protein LOC116417856 [Nasonia vitripennis]